MEELQQRIKEFCEENNMQAPVEHRVLDTVSELGEVAKEILKMTDYGNKPVAYKQEFKEELGDTLYSLITVANSFDIDLEDAVDQALRKYEERLKTGSAGSTN